MKSETPCPLCAEREAHVLGNRARDGTMLRTVLCAGCGLGRVDPLPADEAVSEFYQDNYRREYKGTFEPQPRHVLRAGRIAIERIALLKRWLAPGQTLLDVGCGGGELVYLLGRWGVRARGHEEDVRYAAYARRELGVTVTEGDWSAVRTSAATRFDAVTMFHVLEHLRHPVQALEQVRDWLAPGGVAVVEVPNLEFALTRSTHRFHQAHLYHFNAATLTVAGEQAGLRVQEIYTSPDGGNLIGRFERGQDGGQGSLKIAGNCERILGGEGRRGEARYWLSPGTWRRALRRWQRGVEERWQVNGYRDRRAILDSLAERERGERAQAGSVR